MLPEAHIWTNACAYMHAHNTRHIIQTVQDTDVARSTYVTLHHYMSRNVPDDHFHVLIFSESKFYALYKDKSHFQIRELVAELHVFEYGGTTFGVFEKTCFKC